MSPAHSNNRQRRMIQAGTPVCVLAVSWVLTVLVYGSVSAAFDRVAGYAARPVHRMIDIGQVIASQPVRVAVPVQNLLAEGLTVLGAETDCGCAVAEGLPLEIPAFSVGHFQMVVTPPAGLQDGVLDRSVLLFLNVNSRPVRLRILAAVEHVPG